MDVLPYHVRGLCRHASATVKHVVLHPDDLAREDAEPAGAGKGPLRCEHPPLMLLCSVPQFHEMDFGYGPGVAPVPRAATKNKVKGWTVPSASVRGRVVKTDVSCRRSALPAVDARMATGHAWQGRNVPYSLTIDLGSRFPKSGSLRKEDEKGQKHRLFAHTHNCKQRKAIYSGITRLRPEPVPRERCREARDEAHLVWPPPGRYCDCWEAGRPCPLSELSTGAFTVEDAKTPALRQALCGGMCPMDARYEQELDAKEQYSDKSQQSEQ